MDFKAIENEARKSAKKLGFKVEKIIDKERKIFFLDIQAAFSFFIYCPNEQNQSWMIWSDTENEKDAETIGRILESCDLENCKDITTILDSTSQTLKKELSRAKSDESFDDSDDDGDEIDDYYCQDDEDANNDTETGNEEQFEKDELVSNFFQNTGAGMPAGTAVHRLVKDLRLMQANEGKYGFVGSPRGDDLFSWEVKLVDIPTSCKLGRDLLIFKEKYKKEPVITLDVQFPPDYPFSPPFIRVLTPRFQFLTGHVTVGGSICMEMLTKSGWLPSNDIESILVQVRAEILSDKNASLDISGSNKPYSESEAKSAFDRMVKKYGW